MAREFRVTSVSLPIDVWEFIKDKGNRSQYIADLIKKDLGITKKPIMTKAEVIEIILQFMQDNKSIHQSHEAPHNDGHDITNEALSALEKIFGG